jgi:hypothetical protein
MTSSLAIIAPTEPTKQRPGGEHESRRVRFERPKARGFVRTYAPSCQGVRFKGLRALGPFPCEGFVMRLEAPVAAGDSDQTFSVGRMRIG